jgi:hypothetical protein
MAFNTWYFVHVKNFLEALPDCRRVALQIILERLRF